MQTKSHINYVQSRQYHIIVENTWDTIVDIQIWFLIIALFFPSSVTWVGVTSIIFLLLYLREMWFFLVKISFFFFWVQNKVKKIYIYIFLIYQVRINMGLFWWGAENLHGKSFYFLEETQFRHYRQNQISSRQKSYRWNLSLLLARNVNYTGKRNFCQWNLKN